MIHLLSPVQYLLFSPFHLLLCHREILSTCPTGFVCLVLVFGVKPAVVHFTSLVLIYLFFVHLCPPFPVGPPASQPLSPSISSLLSSRVGPTWHKLANALALTPAEVSAAEVGASTSAGRASLVLNTWRRREGTNSTAEALGTALISAGLANLWESVMTEVTDAEGEGGGE